MSRVAGEVLQQARHLVLDLSGVSAMDSAGIGELALLQTWAERKSVNVKYAGATPLVRRLLELTNLDSVLEVASIAGCGVGFISRGADLRRLLKLGEFPIKEQSSLCSFSFMSSIFDLSR